MPFLVDSVTMEVNRQGLTLHLIVHPIFARASAMPTGALQAIAPRSETPDARARVVDARRGRPGGRRRQQRAALVAGIERVLADVRAAVDDWKPMVSAPARRRSPRLDTPPAVAAEAGGRRKPRVPAMAGRRPLHAARLPAPRPGRRERRGRAAARARQRPRRPARDRARKRRRRSFAALPPEARALARAALPMLVVTKANTRSTVHRPGYIDYIGVKRFDARGEVIGEHRFLGLFTSTAYSARVAEMPLLRRKVEAIVAARRAGAGQPSRPRRSQHILETYPRDELFQIVRRRTATRPRSASCTWASASACACSSGATRSSASSSCLIYVPRENYTTELRLQVPAILIAGVQRHAAPSSTCSCPKSVLARIHITCAPRPAQVPDVDVRETRDAASPRPRAAGTTSCATR